MAGYSKRCHDLTTRWSQNVGSCVPCPLKPGYEPTPNCGYDDDGGRHETVHKRCQTNFYNDGSSARCRPCASCPAGTVKPCASTYDTLCQEVPRSTTTFPSTEITAKWKSTTTKQGTTTPPAPPIPSALATTSTATLTVQWVLPVIMISILLVVLSACLIYMKWKRGGQCKKLARRASYSNPAFTSCSTSPVTDVEDSLSPDITSASLQTVLDNLDVLEELVILLDPESCGIKNTKHLASHCGFSSTWINYVYSMKDSKSPLKALLEGVTSKHPDWTVGNLVKLLRFMDRNDAILALAKLQFNEMDV